MYICLHVEISRHFIDSRVLPSSLVCCLHLGQRKIVYGKIVYSRLGVGLEEEGVRPTAPTGLCPNSGMHPLTEPMSIMGLCPPNGGGGKG